MRKFDSVAMFPENPKWEKANSRIKEMDDSLSGDTPMRSEFGRDYTRIINCNAYRRLKNKTQVFFAPKNDHICTRIEHVNLVESISNTISNYLGLNSELTKAIAVCHDIGHSPFGHQGERILSDISIREYGEKFWHPMNGLHFVDDIELLTDKNGIERNLNLTYAVRDGILGHGGEPQKEGQKPRDEFIDLNEFDYSNKFDPYTWEACVVKIADNISYLGRDIEDAIEMKLLNDRDMYYFNKAIELINVNNSSIIGYLVRDLCENSTVEDGLKFSDVAHDIMLKIVKFNNEKIYKHEKIQPTVRYFKVLMNEIFYVLKKEYNGIETIRNIRRMKRYYPVLSERFASWLERYSNCTDKENLNRANKIIYDLRNEKDYSRAIIDYMSGMTDKYIVSTYNEIISY